MSPERPEPASAAVQEPYRGEYGGFSPGDDLLLKQMHESMEAMRNLPGVRERIAEMQADRVQADQAYRQGQFAAANRGPVYSPRTEQQAGWDSTPPAHNIPDLSQVREGRVTRHVANGVERLLGTQMPEEDRRLLVYGLQKVGGAALLGAGFRDAQGNKIPGGGRRAARHPFQALRSARHATANAADRVVDDIDRIEAARRQRDDYELAA